MKVLIKEFDVGMEVKSKGIEFKVRRPDGKRHIGDCYLTMKGLVWCKGRTDRSNGINVSWDDFTEIMQSKDALKAALEAAKKPAVKAPKKPAVKAPKNA